MPSIYSQYLRALIGPIFFKVSKKKIVMGKKDRCALFGCNNDRIFPEKYTVKFSFCPWKARINTGRELPGNPFRRLKSNKFNMAAVSVNKKKVYWFRGTTPHLSLFDGLLWKNNFGKCIQWTSYRITRHVFKRIQHLCGYPRFSLIRIHNGHFLLQKNF